MAAMAALPAALSNGRFWDASRRPAMPGMGTLSWRTLEWPILARSRPKPEVGLQGVTRSSVRAGNFACCLYADARRPDVNWPAVQVRLRSGGSADEARAVLVCGNGEHDH